jgi:hypothetical protein
MGILDGVQNSNWGTVKNYSTEELLVMAVPGARPRDFFNFVPMKPPDHRHPLVTRGKDGAPHVHWIASPEEDRASRVAEVITLDVWPSFAPGDADEMLANTDNSGACLYVEVEWGSGGTCVTARADVGRGVQLVVPADAIICRLGVDRMPALGTKDDVPWTPLPVQINAMVGRFGQAARWKAKRTLYLDPELPTGNEQFIRVPDFAWGLKMAGRRSVLSNAGILVSAVTNNSAFYWTLDTWTALQLKDATEYFPIPNGTEFIRVQNNSGSDFVDLLSLEFGLTL